MEDETIAVVGVGRMGANMARRLRETGHSVVAVFDARRDTAEALAGELGCAAPATLAEVTAAAGVILTVVTDDAHATRNGGRRDDRSGSPWTGPAPRAWPSVVDWPGRVSRTRAGVNAW